MKLRVADSNLRGIDQTLADRVDAENPRDLCCVNDTTGALLGAVRLLPTTGPDMLRDVFPMLAPGGAPDSPLIWESSRFAINPAILSDAERPTANHGLVEVCQQAGIEHVSVFDAHMVRIGRSVNCAFEIIFAQAPIGRTMTYAGVFDMSDLMRERLGNAGDLHAPVLAPGTRWQAFRRPSCLSFSRDLSHGYLARAITVSYKGPRGGTRRLGA